MAHHHFCYDILADSAQTANAMASPEYDILVLLGCGDELVLLVRFPALGWNPSALNTCRHTSGLKTSEAKRRVGLLGYHDHDGLRVGQDRREHG
jgi:hypothetical protein